MMLEFVPGMIFCSLGVILTCLAIFQVRKERTYLHMRMTKLDKRLDEIEESIYQERWEFLKRELNNGIK